MLMDKLCWKKLFVFKQKEKLVHSRRKILINIYKVMGIWYSTLPGYKWKRLKISFLTKINIHISKAGKFIAYHKLGIMVEHFGSLLNTISATSNSQSRGVLHC